MAGASSSLRPAGDLKPRPQDLPLSVEDLKDLPHFNHLKLDRQLEAVAGHPGIVVLRLFRTGEVICEENIPGFTAFYVMTAEDLAALPDTVKQKLTPTASGSSAVASVLRGGAAQAPAGFWGKMKKALGGDQPSAAAAPSARPGIFAGQLLGEMSCLYRTPRTATVVAERDCYMIEMLRNVLDRMYANQAFAKHLNGLYRERVLQLQLRTMPLFRDLSDDVYERLRARVELTELAPGDLICDEHDRADAIYLIRSGFVKVVKGSSALLGADSVSDMPLLCAELFAASQEAAGPRRKFWDLLSGEAHVLLSSTAAEAELDVAASRQLLFALNDLLKQPKLYTQIDARTLPAAAGWEAEAKKLPATPKQWAQHQQVRDFNRRLVELLLPRGIVPHRSGGAERTLAYRSVAEPWIGEIGVALDEPRSATCIAFVHADEGRLINGRVELVQISRVLFEEIKAASPELANGVRKIAEDRVRETLKKTSLPVWHEATPASLTRRFDELGLIQGQKLMVIDLDRCTRCDKCVEACVESHTQPWWSRLLGRPRRQTQDGRSRLFLDGPRFQVYQDGLVKDYLVPATCRQCKDPICLVGCPVGSIHKGHNNEVVIEDWCIGCTRCASQCPYGAIQMHYVGLIPRRSGGWRHRQHDAAPWRPGTAPFHSDRSLREIYPDPRPITFEHDFAIDAAVAKTSVSFQVLIETAAAAPEMWVNGHKVDLTAVKGSGQGQEKWNLQAMLALDSPAPPPELLPVLRLGANQVRLRVTPAEEGSSLLLDLGLSAVQKPDIPADVLGEFTEDVVLKTAVVCDLCSDQFGQQPACVNACPHEAAMRFAVHPETFNDQLR